ncbi:hypothetical protein WJX74_003934 [Apatococcus lobatus]|uniref:Uncharacterized protein n=1 Tax=Apatococcus lobatus TaxID=904363 RepID=A0AAW1SAN5_9CHLO
MPDFDQGLHFRIQLLSQPGQQLVCLLSETHITETPSRLLLNTHRVQPEHTMAALQPEAYARNGSDNSSNGSKAVMCPRLSDLIQRQQAALRAQAGMTDAFKRPAECFNDARKRSRVALPQAPNHSQAFDQQPTGLPCGWAALHDQGSQLSISMMPASGDQNQPLGDPASKPTLPVPRPASQSTIAAEQPSMIPHPCAQRALRPNLVTSMTSVASVAEQRGTTSAKHQDQCNVQVPQVSSALHLRQLPDSPAASPRLPHTPFLDLQNQWLNPAVPLSSTSMAALEAIPTGSSDDWVQQAVAATTTSFHFPGAVVSGLSHEHNPDEQLSALPPDPAWGDFPSARLSGLNEDTAPSLLPSGLAIEHDHSGDDINGLPDIRLSGLSDLDPGSCNLAALDHVHFESLLNTCVDSSTFAGIEKFAADHSEDPPCCQGMPVLENSMQVADAETLAADRTVALPCYRGVPLSENARPCTSSFRPEQHPSMLFEAALPWASDGKNPGLELGQHAQALEHADAGSDNSELMSAREPPMCTTTSIWDEECMPPWHDMAHDSTSAGDYFAGSSVFGSDEMPWYEMPAMLSNSKLISLSPKCTAQRQPIPADILLADLEFAAPPQCGFTNIPEITNTLGYPDTNVATCLDPTTRGTRPGCVMHRPVICQQESRLSSLLQGLAEPSLGGQQDLLGHHVPALREINLLRGAAARSPRFKALYCRNMQALYPQKQWVELVPALAPGGLDNAIATLAGWYEGTLPWGANLSLPVPGQSRRDLLSELAAIPMKHWRKYGVLLLSRARNAQAFSKRSGDAPSQRALQSIAALMMAGFALSAISDENAEAVLAMHGCAFDALGKFEERVFDSHHSSLLLDKLKLTKHQQRLAKEIWKQYQGDLAAMKQERRHITSSLQAMDVSACMQPDSFSETTAILEQAAALAENSSLQQEITLSSHRKFILQVCSPEAIADVYASAWPSWPDKTEMLRQGLLGPARQAGRCISFLAKDLRLLRLPGSCHSSRPVVRCPNTARQALNSAVYLVLQRCQRFESGSAHSPDGACQLQLSSRHWKLMQKLAVGCHAIDSAAASDQSMGKHLAVYPQGFLPNS